MGVSPFFRLLYFYGINLNLNFCNVSWFFTGLCDEYTLIEVNVHVVSCECMNDAACILIQDVPKCICKPGFKGEHCEIMEDPCMVPRCNFGTCIPTDGVNFKCLCQPRYTGLFLTLY